MNLQYVHQQTPIQKEAEINSLTRQFKKTFVHDIYLRKMKI